MDTVIWVMISAIGNEQLGLRIAGAPGGGEGMGQGDFHHLQSVDNFSRLYPPIRVQKLDGIRRRPEGLGILPRPTCLFQQEGHQADEHQRDGQVPRRHRLSSGR